MEAFFTTLGTIFMYLTQTVKKKKKVGENCSKRRAEQKYTPFHVNCTGWTIL